MKITFVDVLESDLVSLVKDWIHQPHRKVSVITSQTGAELLLVMLDSERGVAELWRTKLSAADYPSLTHLVPALHWQERQLWDMFGIVPKSHPRLKHFNLHEPYAGMAPPLCSIANVDLNLGDRIYSFLEVRGDGVYEIPVGPIHAGIIEPGHFRFSCLGEVIANLEIRLGYTHRGVEKRITEVPWRQSRFVVESAASDCSAAYGLAHAEALESLFEEQVSPFEKRVRAIALELERGAMHLSDLSGIAGDIGYLPVAGAFSRMRGDALGLCEVLSGTRLQRFFIRPGGGTRSDTKGFGDLLRGCRLLAQHLKPVVEMLLDNTAVLERLKGVGKVSSSLARDFGLTGVAGRASGMHYDVRSAFKDGPYADIDYLPCVSSEGDVYARVQVRVQELTASLAVIDRLLDDLPNIPATMGQLPDMLPPNAYAVSVVEGHRGELVHLISTDDAGNISRYAIKDPSVNNWTGLAIAVRENLVADFPVCNKSFSLSYSGNDL